MSIVFDDNVLGITVFLISFLACFGAISESSFLIFSYSVLLTFILMGQFAGGITAFIMKKNLSEGNRFFFEEGILSLLEGVSISYPFFVG